MVLVGNLNGNSALCIDIILAVAVLGLASKMTSCRGHLFTLSECTPFSFGEFVTFSTCF